MSTKKAPNPEAADDFLRQYLSKVMKIADAGNTDAGKRLLQVGADILRLLAPEMARYGPLMVWMAGRIEAAAENPKQAGVALRIARGKGTPPKDANNMHARLKTENVKIFAVLTVMDALRAGAVTTASRRNEKTAFEIARDAIAREYGVRRSPETIRHWYEDREAVLPVKRHAGPARRRSDPAK